MKNFTKTNPSILAWVYAVGYVAMNIHVKAVSILPTEIAGLINSFGKNGTKAGIQGAGYITTISLIVFAIIFLLAIVQIVQAAIKYIQSQGDSGKMEEAQKAIKAVLMGFAALFIGILLLVLVMAFTSFSQVSDIPLPCLAYPNSYTCVVDCRGEGSIYGATPDAEQCQACELEIKNAAKDVDPFETAAGVCKKDKP